MKAMIFAAGLGTRLRPLTDNCPKALVAIAGKPMLEHVILRLKAAGFDHIVINIHHFGQQIIDFLRLHENFGLRIDISDEREELLDTGGGIRNAACFLDDNEPFLVHNVDIVSDLDLRLFYETHVRSGALASLLAGERETSRYLLFDETQRLCGWENRKTGEVKSPYPDFQAGHYTAYAFGGIHVLSPRVFQWMHKWKGKFSIIDFYLSIAAQTEIRAYCPSCLEWMDVGKPESLAVAEKLMNGGYAKNR